MLFGINVNIPNPVKIACQAACVATAAACANITMVLLVTLQLPLRGKRVATGASSLINGHSQRDWGMTLPGRESKIEPVDEAPHWRTRAAK